MIEVLALMLVLLFGIFLGIDTAERNIQKIQGSEGASRAVQITPENGRVEIAVLGHAVKTEAPVENVEEQVEKKKQKVKEMRGEIGDRATLLAQVGNEMGQGLRKGTRKALDLVVGWIQER